MALTKVGASGVNLADTFAFTGTVSGVGGLRHTQTVNVTTAVATVDIDNLSTDFDTFYISFDVHPATDNVGLLARFLDTSGNSMNSASDYGVGVNYMDSATNQVSSNGRASMAFDASEIGNNSYESIAGGFWLHNRNFTTADTDKLTPSIWGIANTFNLNGNHNSFSFTGVLDESAADAIRGMRFFFDAGNIDEATFHVYGYEK